MAETITAVVGLLGLGGLIGAYASHRFEMSRKTSERLQDLKEKRYLAMVILMMGRVRPTVDLVKIAEHRPDLSDAAKVNAELQAELLNALIFASEKALASIAAFLENSSILNYAHALQAIREDLWRDKRPLSAEVIDGVIKAAFAKHIAEHSKAMSELVEKR